MVTDILQILRILYPDKQTDGVRIDAAYCEGVITLEEYKMCFLVTE